MSFLRAASTPDGRRHSNRRLFALGGLLVAVTGILVYERSCMSRFDRLVELVEARTAEPFPATSDELTRDVLDRTGTPTTTSAPTCDTYVVTGALLRQELTVRYTDTSNGLRASRMSTTLDFRFGGDRFNYSIARYSKFLDTIAEDAVIQLTYVALLVPPFAFFLFSDRGRRLLREAQSAITPASGPGGAEHPAPMLLGFAVFALLASRRWCQLRSPQVWCEDGTVFLPEFMEHGWSAIVRPVAGYLTLVPRLVSAVSVEASLYRYPEISTALSVAFEVFVVLSVAHAPTVLRARAACAVATVLVPCEPETLFLPSYTQWWAALLLFLAALWNRNSPRWGWRLAFLLLGGLSTPFVLVIVPVLALRSFADPRSWREHVCTLAGTATAAVQIYFVLSSGNSGVGVLGTGAMRMLVDSVPVFFGQFLAGNFTENLVVQWPVGLAVAALFATSIVSRRGGWDADRATILYLSIATIVLSAMRNDIFHLMPRVAGPRYFLIPFVLWMWLLVQMFVTVSRFPKHAVRALVACTALGAFANAMPAWQKCHDDHEWRLNLCTARMFPDYEVPIAWIGDAEDCWWTSFPRDEIARRLARDPFFDEATVRAFPYLVGTGAESAFRPSPVTVVRKPDADEVGFPSPFPEARLVGTSDADDSGWGTGSLRLRMRKGDRIAVQVGEFKSQHLVVEGSEPRFLSLLPRGNGWRLLTFDSDRLPDEFVLRIEDRGDNPDGWTIVAVGNESVFVVPGSE